MPGLCKHLPLLAIPSSRAVPKVGGIYLISQITWESVSNSPVYVKIYLISTSAKKRLIMCLTLSPIKGNYCEEETIWYFCMKPIYGLNIKVSACLTFSGALKYQQILNANIFDGHRFGLLSYKLVRQHSPCELVLKHVQYILRTS